jgi:hypothetical protein
MLIDSSGFILLLWTVWVCCVLLLLLVDFIIWLGRGWWERGVGIYDVGNEIWIST